MITTAILSLIFGFISWVLSPITNLPDVLLDPNITSAISTAGGYLGMIDSVFPIGTFLIVFGIILGIDAGIIVYRVIMWGIRKIPGVG